MIDDVDELYVRSEEILQIIREVYAEHEDVVTLPDRQIIVAGAGAPHDCEQVSISFMSMDQGLPQQGPPTNQCESPNNITFLVEIARPTAASQRGRNTASIVPPEESVNEKTRVVLRDVRLLGEIGERIGAASWLPPSTYSIAPGPRSGQMQATTMEINVVL